MDFLDYIYINKFFYTLKVRLWFPKEIPSQAYINKKKCRNVTGRILYSKVQGTPVNQ